jgi:hypothetical protein
MEPMEGRYAHSIPNISEAYLKRADLCGTHLNMGGEKPFFRERYFLCDQVGKAGSNKISWAHALRHPMVCRPCASAVLLQTRSVARPQSMLHYSSRVVAFVR